MNENHQRHLLSTFQHVDNLLSEAEHILISAGSPSPFQEYSHDSTPIQRKVTHDYILRVRETMRRVLQELEIPMKRPVSGAIWAARSHVSFASIAIADIEPKPMLGYGKLSESDEATLDKIVAELNAALNRLGTYLAQGTDADLQSRLQRLEQTQDEIKLLCELERIITTHGLVEFRAALTLLLDRMETNVFEIGVFGRVSSGKSSLLNHLLGGEFLPAGVTPVTAVPTRISFGPQPQATIEFAENKPQIVELSRLVEFSTEQQNPANAKHVMRIHVQVPAGRLHEGVTFVDTPGLGSLATAGAEETAAYLPRCDLGIVLLDAGAALTHEDLAVVQALYQSGAMAMALVSKADLLVPVDRERTVNYIRQHLQSEVNLDLPVHLISVVGADERLCDEWFEHELKPLLESYRENASASLKRKIGGLREAVEQVLQRRIENAGNPSPKPDSDQPTKEAVEALQNADAILESAQRKNYQITDEVRLLKEKIIEAAAEDIPSAWSSADKIPKEPAVIFAASLSRVVSGQSSKYLETIAGIRKQLAQTLQLAHRASHTKHKPEELPDAGGLPLIDPSPLSKLVALKKPPLLSVFGKPALRGYVRRQLEKQLVNALPVFLSLMGKQFEQWNRRALAESGKTFAASAEIYRTQFELSQRMTSGKSDLAGMQADLHVLQEWRQ